LQKFTTTTIAERVTQCSLTGHRHHPAPRTGGWPCFPSRTPASAYVGTRCCQPASGRNWRSRTPTPVATEQQRTGVCVRSSPSLICANEETMREVEVEMCVWPQLCSSQDWHVRVAPHIQHVCVPEFLQNHKNNEEGMLAISVPRAYASISLPIHTSPFSSTVRVFMMPRTH